MNDLDILQQINKIGQLLLKHGAEIYRVEESLKRMCEGFGFTDIEVFAIPTYFTLSLTLHDGTPYQSSKRSRSNRTHLDHLYELNCLVRQISNQELSLEEIKDKIQNIETQRLNYHLILMGYIVSAAMFCVFFGGHVSEMIVSAFIGFILYYFIYLFRKIRCQWYCTYHSIKYGFSKYCDYCSKNEYHYQSTVSDHRNFNDSMFPVSLLQIV